MVKESSSHKATKTCPERSRMGSRMGDAQTWSFFVASCLRVRTLFYLYALEVGPIMSLVPAGHDVLWRPPTRW
jgi:hypothetical protein